MRIDGAGLVGIGTTTPREKLDIFDGKLTFSDTDVNGEMLSDHLPVIADVYVR